MISDKKAVQDLIVLMWEKGIRNVVISPGSRNAPLTVSLNNYKEFNCYSVVDERSAGYIALGMAQSSRSPVALVCTSGTAALNYGPAVAEAFYQHIPLVVITADRPKELIDQGHGQSIRQIHSFHGHTLKTVDLQKDVADEQSELFNARLINEALNTAIGESPGPVHINIPLEENLYGTMEFPKSFPKVIEDVKMIHKIDPVKMNHFKTAIEEDKKVLILCGLMDENPELQSSLEKLSHLNQLLILTESTSNLGEKSFVTCIDRLIMTFDENDESEFVPDVLISIGENIISKKIKHLLSKGRIKEHWHITRSKAQDTFGKLTHHIHQHPDQFFEQMGELKSNESQYSSQWSERNNINRKNASVFLQKAPYSDYKVFGYILPKIPGDSVFQMGNSSVVRYVQLFDSRDDIDYYSNRGTSGIDGCTSTAVGTAMVTDKPVFLISGDLAFFYDSNALWNNYIKKNLKIIVINNSGGGIFRIIDGPSKTEQLEQYFEARHNKSVRELTLSHGLNYFSASDEYELDVKMDELLNSDECAVLEVFTNPETNDGVLKDFFRFLKSNKEAIINK